MVRGWLCASTPTGSSHRRHQPDVQRTAPAAADGTSPVHDYRYAGRSGHSINIRACTLEPDLADRCRRLATDLALPFAGIDLRRTPEGHWYCFEVNPSPGFTFYQEATGQKIAEAVASLLISHDQIGKGSANKRGDLRVVS
ncbi:MAG: hypothetical protein JO251_02735 [Verrucomicrobia bacterium]|nr:hypothetical protein [Verrucomicrobiota bacterium]